MPAGYYNMSAAVAEQYQLLAATNVMQYKRCNCKKAKCLKLYCVCFAAGEISCLLYNKHARPCACKPASRALNIDSHKAAAFQRPSRAVDAGADRK
jgi:hypothetical protein